ncbi:hypothetical protein ACVBEF_04135 [Glaciimonas sp. GG7]
MKIKAAAVIALATFAFSQGAMARPGPIPPIVQLTECALIQIEYDAALAEYNLAGYQAKGGFNGTYDGMDIVQQLKAANCPLPPGD